jgi:hypothetical protein
VNYERVARQLLRDGNHRQDAGTAEERGRRIPRRQIPLPIEIDERNDAAKVTVTEGVRRNLSGDIGQEEKGYRARQDLRYSPGRQGEGGNVACRGLCTGRRSSRDGSGATTRAFRIRISHDLIRRRIGFGVRELGIRSGIHDPEERTLIRGVFTDP